MNDRIEKRVKRKEEIWIISEGYGIISARKNGGRGKLV